MHARAIETRYKGYRFRSRLEARWAVFFDALGLKWEYEPEGFELPSGRYLPDFWLPDLGAYVEIKPVQPDRLERTKARDLAVGTKRFVAFGVGMPGGSNRNVSLMAFGPTSGWDWGETSTPDCYSGWIMLAGPKANPEQPAPDPRYWDARCEKAQDAARSARFEHGESGARR